MRVTSDSLPLVDKTLEMVSFPPCESHYEKLSCLGSVCGSIGLVWAAKHKATNENVAVKVYNLDKCEDEMELIQHEISTVRQLKHPNIIQYITSFISNQQLWIVMPLVGYTSAYRIVETYYQQGLPEAALSYIIRDVLKGLQYLHNNGIIHRAIKGSHVLVKQDGICCLSGLRHSVIRGPQGKFKSIHSYPTQAKHNLNWLSPEILAQDLLGYNEKSDIYSVGILVCELANGQVPYHGMEECLMFLEKYEGRNPYICDATTYEEFYENGSTTSSILEQSTQRKFTKYAHQFVKVTLSKEPSHRPSASQLLSHPFITQHGKLGRHYRHMLQCIPSLNNGNCTADSSIPDLLEDSMDRISLCDETNWEF